VNKFIRGESLSKLLNTVLKEKMVDIHLQVEMYLVWGEGDTIWGRLGPIIHGGYLCTGGNVRGEGDTLSVIG
jgi:hypothetical protein